MLGSGLGSYADTLEDRVVVPYPEIPHMAGSAIEGHAGNLVFGRAEGVPVVAMQGRVHLYEGHSPADVVFGVRLMIRCGAQVLIVTNAAGGINEDFVVGDLMAIEDHVNLTGTSLGGRHEPDLGGTTPAPQFVDMTAAYDPQLREIAREGAHALGFNLREGVYAGMRGPAYETPAEIRMLRSLGAHAVGMSTVLEVTAARQLGARVLGISCITNKAAGLGTEELSHQDVKHAAAKAHDRFCSLLGAVLRRIE